VQLGELLAADAFLLQECYRQGVTQRQRDRRAGGGYEVVRTGLLGDRGIERHRGYPGQRRIGATGDGDDRNSKSLQRAHQAEQVLG
jgi:hypothetical protein